MSKKAIVVGIGSVGAGIIESLAKQATKEQQDELTFVFIGTEENEIVQMKKVSAIVHYFFIPTRQLTQSQFSAGIKPIDVLREDLNNAILADTFAPFDDILNDAYTLRNNEILSTSVSIMIVGSLSSAVGSAFALPIAKFIREHSTKRIAGSRMIMSGLFLLPEVLNYLVHGDEEHKILAKSASLSLQEINDSLGEEEELFDYCFLLDDQNVNGMVLKDYNEYREYAAACAYSMIMAPESLNQGDLSVSSIGVAKTKCFSGYGTAIMSYSPELVNEYLASCWAQTLLCDDVFAADRAYRAKQENAPIGVQKTMRESFVSYFDDNAGDFGSLEYKIKQQTMKTESETDKTEQPVGIENYYVAALDEFLYQQLNQERDNTLEPLITNINEARSQLGKKGKAKEKPQKTNNSGDNDNSGLVYQFDQLYEAIKAYEKYIILFSKKLSWDIVTDLFEYSERFIKTKQPYRIEYWLQENNKEGAFRHPLVVRLILYRAIRALKENLSNYESDFEDAKAFIDNFEINNFDDKRTEGVIETKDDYYTRVGFDKKGIAAFISRGDIDVKKKRLLEAYDELSKHLDSYLDNYVYREVFKNAISELEKRAECYEIFFDTMDKNRSMLTDCLEALGHDSQMIHGRAVVPVCTSNQVMQKLFETLKDKMTSLTIPGEVYAGLYNKFIDEIKENEEQTGSDGKVKKRIPTAKRYMTIYQEALVEALRSSVQNEFGELYDFDVLSAAELEYQLLGDEAEQKSAEEYIEWLFQTARVLSAPFVEVTGIKRTAIKRTCTYSPKLESPDLLAPTRQGFVQNNLKAQGGIECTKLGTNMILFNQLIPEIDIKAMSWFVEAESSGNSDIECH